MLKARSSVFFTLLSGVFDLIAMSVLMNAKILRLLHSNANAHKAKTVLRPSFVKFYAKCGRDFVLLININLHANNCSNQTIRKKNIGK